MKTVNSVHTHASKNKPKNIKIGLKNNDFFRSVLGSFYFCNQGNMFYCNRKNNSNLHAKNVTCLKSKEAEMVSTIDINSNSNMSAQEKLEQIQYPVENLQLTLSTLTKMSLDVSLTAEELTALLTTLHKQVVDIQRAIEA